MLRDLFFSKKLYIKVRKNRFEVTDLESGITSFAEATEEPFTTKRLLIGNFAAAEKCLSKLVFDALGRPSICARPRVLIHPLEVVEQELLCEVERRVFLELGYSTGSRSVTIIEGDKLSNEEALARLS